MQERHEEIKRIEQTLAELAQLFNDVSYTTALLNRNLRLTASQDERSSRTTGRGHQYDRDNRG